MRVTPELVGTNHQTEKAAEAAQTEQVEAVMLATNQRTVTAVLAGVVPSLPRTNLQAQQTVVAARTKSKIQAHQTSMVA